MVDVFVTNSMIIIIFYIHHTYLLEIQVDTWTMAMAIFTEVIYFYLKWNLYKRSDI